MSFDEAEHHAQVSASGPSAPEGATVYFGFFWSEMHMEVTFQVASTEVAEVIKGGQLYLSSQDIFEVEYKKFLIDRVSNWDGAGTHITTVPAGKLVMLASALEPSASPTASSATG